MDVRKTRVFNLFTEVSHDLFTEKSLELLGELFRSGERPMIKSTTYVFEITQHGGEDLFDADLVYHFWADGEHITFRCTFNEDGSIDGHPTMRYRRYPQ